MITLTQQAIAKISELLAEESTITRLRIYVEGGGCSGFQYGFSFDDEQGDDDFELEFGPIKLLVDSMSMQYLTNATVDYTEDLMGSSFSIKNPEATSTCGCGNSFSV